MTADTTELRTRARLIEPGFPGTAEAVTAAAAEIDALRAQLASAPHLAVCTYMTAHFAEPCSCWKTETQLESPLALDAVTRLTVAGPHGPVVGLPRVAGVHLDVADHHLTVSYTNP